MANGVKIFTKATCPYCIRAKQLFQRLGVKFEEVSVDGKPQLRDEIAEKYDWPTVPVIVVGEKCLGGYDDVAKLERQGLLMDMLARVE